MTGARTRLPAVTAVIPARSPDVALMVRAVESALLCEPMERVIVVDSGSPEAIDRGALPGDARVEVVRTERPGPSAARNVGLDLAATPWVLLLDHDDAAEVAGLEAGLRLGVELRAAAVVSARVEERAGADGVMVDRVRPVPGRLAGRTLARADEVFEPIALYGSTGVLVRQSVLLDGVRFDEDLWIGEDRDFLRRVGARGGIAVNPEVAVRRRLHDEGAANLSGPRHMERRVRDHLVILERWFSVESAGHFRDATMWLINACARTGVSDAAWRELVSAARVHGWRVPMKARWRRWRAGSVAEG